MTLGDRERRRGKRGHLSFPPLLSEFHRCRRAQLGRALGSGRQALVLQTGKLRPGRWQDDVRVSAGWPQRKGQSQLLGYLHPTLSLLKGKGPWCPKVI